MTKILNILITFLRYINYLAVNSNEILAKNTGKSYEQLERDMARDNWMSAKESVEYGLCDEIITKIEL